jgi:hypothetical protein
VWQTHTDLYYGRKFTCNTKQIMMKKTILLFLLSIAMLHAAAQRPAGQVFEHTPELHGDSVVFALTLVNAYPFVSV